MNQNANTAATSKTYLPPMPTFWWLQTRPFIKFMAREMSSFFVAYLVVITLMLVNALINGPEAYEEYQACLASPIMVVISGVGLLFAVLHTVTWFNATPRAVVVRMGGKKLPEAMIIAPNYVAWLVISAFVAWVVVGG